MIEQNQHLDALQDIRRMMQRSSRFISLSGLSGIAAGIWALIGAYFAYDWVTEYFNTHFGYDRYSGPDFENLKLRLLLLAGAVLGLALLSAFFFTWRRASKHKVSVWDHTARQLALNTAIPLFAGGLFILAMLQYGVLAFIAPASLLFYGLALVNGSKYTLSDIRYLGFLEILLGLISTQYLGYGIYFWAVGFGMLHIIYGFVMWWKYERKPVA